MELQHFPFKNQLTDGDKNAQFNCIAHCMAAAVEYLTGKATDGAELKGKLYGPNHLGDTYISDYVDELASRGVLLTTLEGTPQELIRHISSELAHNHPVIAAEISPYANPELNLKHMIVFYRGNATTLTVMDPFGAHAVTKTHNEWASLLQYGQVWSLKRKDEQIMPTIPTGWKDDGHVLKAPNGLPVIMGFRDFVLNHQWHADNWPLESEQGMSQLEISNPNLGGGTRQRFRTTTLEWTQARGVFEAWTGLELIALHRVIGQIAMERDALKDKLKADTVTIDAYRKQLQQQFTQLQNLQAQLAEQQKERPLPPPISTQTINELANLMNYYQLERK